MPKRKPSRLGSEPAREPFITIDDCIETVHDLLKRLHKLATYKYPLSVRRGKGVIQIMSNTAERESEQVRAGSRTYFLDIEKTAEGKRYLRITESRYKGEGKERERSTIIVFPEDAEKFTAALAEMVEKLKE